MLTGFGNVMQNFDFIGKSVSFRIGDNSNIKTSCGGLSSILILISIIYIFFSFFIPFIQRDDIDLTYIYQKDVFPTRFYVNNSNFFIAVSFDIEDEDNKDIFDLIEIKLINYIQYFTPKNLSYVFYDSGKNFFYFIFLLHFLEIQLNYCHPADNFTILKNRFESFNPDFSLPCTGLYFADFKEGEKYYLEGSTINNNFSYFALETKIKISSFTNNKLELLNKLNNVKMNIYYSDVAIDYLNSNFTPNYFISYLKVDINTLEQTTGLIKFLQNDLNIDKNFFSREVSSKNCYLMHSETNSMKSSFNSVYQELITNNKPIEEASLLLAKFDFVKSKFNIQYNAVFKKIPIFLAQTGGVLNAMVTFIKLLGSILIDFQFYSNVLKLTLDIDFESSKKKLIIHNPKIENNKKDQKFGEAHLKNLFNEINFIKPELKKNNINDKEKLTREKFDSFILSDTMINRDQNNSVINPVLKKGNDSQINHRKYQDKNKLKIQNYLINLDRGKVDDSNSNRSAIFDEDIANKLNSYMIEVDKNNQSKKSLRKTNIQKDDVFFKDNIFNFLDFIYEIYKSFPKVKPIAPLENRNDLFKKSKNNFDRNFEINNIIKKNIEIDLIKYLLMSSDQLNLYRLVKKPLISLENGSLSPFNKAYDEFSQDKLYTKDDLKSLSKLQKESIKKSFSNIYQKKQTNIVNRKLLRIVEDRIPILLDD